MPWQRWVVRRALETDGAGRLLWQRVVVLMSRQQGKTYMMRRFLSWRVMGARFGQAERVLSTHADGAQATLLLQPWAQEEMPVGRVSSLGMAVSWYPDGRVSTTERAWIARASQGRGITGYSGLTTVYVDEVQSVPRRVVQQALLPAMSSARVRQPQAWFTGTGEHDGSELLRVLRSAAADPAHPTLWLEWSAPPGCATDDPGAWVWASPDWSEERAAYLRTSVAEMPEVEFRSEYLVQHDAKVSWWVPEDAVAGCARPSVVFDGELVGAVEVALGEQSWAAAVSDGVRCSGVAGLSLEGALGWLRERGPRVVLAHVAVRDRLPVDGWEVRPVRVHEAAAAASSLRDAVLGGGVEWDSGGVMRDQFARVVVAEVEGLRRIVDSRSRGDVSLVKALSWAVWWARQNPVEVAAVF